MGFEIELKVKAEHDAVRSRLVELGAACQGAVLETNRLFDCRDGRLRRAGVGLRLRRVDQGPDSAATVTVKGPVQPGPFKMREEEEFEVDDSEAVVRALALLGFEPVCLFQKRRETWRLGDCLIELDTVPFLGCYVEIEGASSESVAETQSRLGLQDSVPIRDSYVALLETYCQTHGRDPLAIVFADPTGRPVRCPPTGGD